MDEWKKITVQYAKHCIECSKLICPDEEALWMKGLGLKHIECPTEIIEDHSQLIIIDEEDKEKLGLK